MDGDTVPNVISGQSTSNTSSSLNIVDDKRLNNVLIEQQLSKPNILDKFFQLSTLNNVDSNFNGEHGATSKQINEHFRDAEFVHQPNKLLANNSGGGGIVGPKCNYNNPLFFQPPIPKDVSQTMGASPFYPPQHPLLPIYPISIYNDQIPRLPFAYLPHQMQPQYSLMRTETNYINQNASIINHNLLKLIRKNETVNDGSVDNQSNNKLHIDVKDLFKITQMYNEQNNSEKSVDNSETASKDTRYEFLSFVFSLF